jgi:hypothetical protein
MKGVPYLSRREEVDREIASMRKFHKKLLRSKKKARAFLIKCGILNKTGKKLAKMYREDTPWPISRANASIYRD